jgi:membrane protein
MPLAQYRAPLARALDAIKRMFKHLNDVRTFGLAAEMAFWVFLSLIPLAAVAGLVSARLAVHHWGAVAPLLTSLPPAAQRFIADRLVGVAAWNGGTVGLPAALVFAWLASSGVHAVFDALEIQTQSSRPWWKKRLLALGACVGLSIGFGALALIATGLGWITRLLTNVPLVGAAEQSTLTERAVRVVAGGLVLFGLNAGLFWVGVPQCHRRRTPIAPGALLATFLETALGASYALYIHTTGTGDAYQGALAIIGITMTTLYLVSVAILVGAELNRFLAVRHDVDVGRHQPSRLHHPHAQKRLA